MAEILDQTIEHGLTLKQLTELRLDCDSAQCHIIAERWQDLCKHKLTIAHVFARHTRCNSAQKDQHDTSCVASLSLNSDKVRWCLKVYHAVVWHGGEMLLNIPTGNSGLISVDDQVRMWLNEVHKRM